MIIHPISNNFAQPKQKYCSFASTTEFQQQKITEKDLLTLEYDKDIFKNLSNPNQSIIGIHLKREDENIDIISRYGHKIGNINFDKSAKQPQINLQMGAFQPVIEIKDEELGITLLLTRGSKLKGKSLNIDYKELTKPNISFGHKLVVTTGYKSEQLEQVTNNYFSDTDRHNSDLSQEYTFVGLGGGYGTRLKPISDLYNANKPTTRYPGETKTLFQVAVLDAVNNVGSVDNVQFIKDDENNISGTAGIIIKGLRSGTIPKHKPLVLLTGDIFHNIDLAKALKQYEQDSNCGMAMLVKELTPTDLYDKSLVKLAPNSNSEHLSTIDAFSPKLDSSNSYIKDDYASYSDGKHYYTSTNVTIIHPKILSFIEKFADIDGKADFLEFLGLMFNVMNKPAESLQAKYPDGLQSEGLTLDVLTDYSGYPSGIYSDNHEKLELKAIIAQDKNGINPIWEDVGTIEDYLKIIHLPPNDDLRDFDILNSFKNYVDKNGVVLLNETAKEKLAKFKEKYGIEELSGNVIAYAKDNQSSLSLLNHNHSKILLENLDNSKKSKEYVQKLIKQYGITNFTNWYLHTYYSDYEQYLNDYFEQANSIEDLLKFQPNWAPWKLEEKKWLLENPQFKNYTFEQKRSYLNNYWDGIREIPFEIGNVPSGLGDKYSYRTLINKLKKEDIKNDTLYVDGNYVHLKRLKGGEYNNKFVYLAETNNKKFILKFERINVEDADYINNRTLSLFEKKAIRKEKYLASDSVYSNACVSKYLELNGCQNIPKLHYYDHQTHSSVYEYVEDVKGDEFQKDIIDEEYMTLDEMNDMFKDINNLGIYLNDSAYKNILVDKNGIRKIIDLGHVNFIHPLKPGVKRFNIELGNTNGPDLRNIFAGFWLSSFLQ